MILKEINIYYGNNNAFKNYTIEILVTIIDVYIEEMKKNFPKDVDYLVPYETVSVVSASIEEVIEAAKMAGAHEFILELPEGYDNKVGERGTSLSGGQQQRLAIARAILTNPTILIFDEATSALDYESERIIMENLDAISSGRTMLMIAHRLSTVRRCDLILVVERGQVVEQGTHEQLMEFQGIYYKLYMQQEV